MRTANMTLSTTAVRRTCIADLRELVYFGKVDEPMMGQIVPGSVPCTGCRNGTIKYEVFFGPTSNRVNANCSNGCVEFREFEPEEAFDPAAE